MLVLHKMGYHIFVGQKTLARKQLYEPLVTQTNMAACFWTMTPAETASQTAHTPDSVVISTIGCRR